MGTIHVTYTINLPDNVDAVGGILLYEDDNCAIANISRSDGTESAWWKRPENGMWLRVGEGFRFLHSTRSYTVVNGSWKQDA